MSHKHPEQPQLYRRVSKDGSHAPFGFQHIRDEEQLFRKPTLLCCGGMFINAKEPEGKKNCNGFAKIAHGLLCFPESFPVHKNAHFTPEIDVVNVIYPEGAYSLAEQHHSRMRALAAGRDEPPPAAIKAFVKQHFLPLLQDEAGSPLPPETMQRNLRNIQVLAHSYGSTFIHQLGDALTEQLEAMHLTPQQVHDVTSQVLVVSVGGISPPGASRASFTEVGIVNMNDTEIRNSYNLPETVNELLHQQNLLVDGANKPIPPRAPIERMNPLPAKPLNILPVQTSFRQGQPAMRHQPGSPTWLACASQPIILNGIGDIIRLPVMPNHERSNERGIFDGTQTATPDNTHHQPMTYFTNKRQRDPSRATAPSEHTEHAITLRTLMSSLLINAMNNAVQNRESSQFTPLPPVPQLVQLPQLLEYQTALDVPLRHAARADRYDEKIAAGLSTERAPAPAPKR